jgi:hypothetical protein
MIILMNSAMIPCEGKYEAKRVDISDVVELMKKYDLSEIKSYVGYVETAQYMSKVLGIEVAVSREQTSLKNGDVMVVCKLKYRLQNPAVKGSFVPTDEDYEWWIIKYTA